MSHTYIFVHNILHFICHTSKTISFQFFFHDFYFRNMTRDAFYEICEFYFNRFVCKCVRERERVDFNLILYFN